MRVRFIFKVNLSVHIFNNSVKTLQTHFPVCEKRKATESRDKRKFSWMLKFFFIHHYAWFHQSSNHKYSRFRWINVIEKFCFHDTRFTKCFHSDHIQMSHIKNNPFCLCYIFHATEDCIWSKEAFNCSCSQSWNLDLSKSSKLVNEENQKIFILQFNDAKHHIQKREVWIEAKALIEIYIYFCNIILSDSCLSS
jgi:hypothetical protein